MNDTIETLRLSIDANDRRMNDILISRDIIFQERDTRYEQRYSAAVQAINLAVESARAAADKAETSVERRFGLTNEWRATTNDVISTRLSRDEYASSHGSLTTKIDDLTARVLMIEGQRGGIGSSITTIMMITSILLALGLGIINLMRNSPPIRTAEVSSFLII